MFSVKQVSTKHEALWPLNLWAMNSICARAKDKLGIFLDFRKTKMPVFQYSLQKIMGFFRQLIIFYSFWNSFYLPLSDAKIKLGVSMLNFAKKLFFDISSAFFSVQIALYIIQDNFLNPSTCWFMCILLTDI